MRRSEKFPPVAEPRSLPNQTVPRHSPSYYIHRVTEARRYSPKPPRIGSYHLGKGPKRNLHEARSSNMLDLKKWISKMNLRIRHIAQVCQLALYLGRLR